MKVAQEQRLQLKMKFLLGYNMKVVIYFGELKFDGTGVGAHFSWWKEMKKL